MQFFLPLRRLDGPELVGLVRGEATPMELGEIPTLNALQPCSLGINGSGRSFCGTTLTSVYESKPYSSCHCCAGQCAAAGAG